MRRVDLLLVVLASSAGCSSGRADVKRADLDGVWAGATAKEENIGFLVARGAVARLEFEWHIPFDEPCRTDPSSPIARTVLGGQDTLFFHPGSPGHEPIPIANGAWKLDQSPMTGRSDVAMSITAKFAGDEATGEPSLETISGCKGRMTTSWKAVRTRPQAAATAAPAAGAVPPAAPRPKLTSALFETILTAKMTQAGVEALLGPGKASGRAGVPAEMMELVWQDEGGSITIQFKDGRAHGGVSSLRQPR
jgi:hypothetical protein